MRLNLCFLRHTWVHNPNSKSIGFCTAHGRKFLYFTVGNPFLQKFLLLMGIWIPSNSSFPWASQAHNPNSIMIGSAVFARDCRVSIYFTMARPFPPSKLPLFLGDVDHHLMCSFLGQLESSIQTASQSVQPFLQGSLAWQTDRPCYSVGNNRLHLRT